MKKLFLLLLLLFSSCSKNETENKEIRPITKDKEINNIAYALGVQYARSLKSFELNDEAKENFIFG